MTDRQGLIDELQRYKTTFATEHQFIARFLNLLTHPRSFYRDHLPGHITASAWIVDNSRSRVLLTHHAKLNRWLQPGGHADGDEDVLRVAKKEALEETGLLSLRSVTGNIFDIDIHSIPERNGFPRHDHYDIRFLLTGNPAESFTVTEESHALAWVEIDSVPDKTGYNESILRMLSKL